MKGEDSQFRARALDLVERVLTRPLAERSGFLDRMCGDDRKLRDAVVELLVARKTAGESSPESVDARTDAPTRAPEITVTMRGLAAPPLGGAAPLEGAPGPGDIFADRYRIEKELGRGAFGVVYRAFDQGPLQRKVALKVIRFDRFGSPAQAATARERFIEEARLAGKLSHGNLATIHEVGEHRQWVYMTQELARGHDLSKVLAEKNRLPLRQVIAIVRQICDGLSHAHAQGVVHRDIKPGNVVIHEADGEVQVKVTDFGLAQPPVSEDSSLEGLVAGTLGYMAPEQLLGKRVDHRADIFATGSVLYEVLVGRRAFQGDTFSSAAEQTLRVSPPAPSRVQDDLPRALDRIVAKAIAKEPDDRYQDINQLAQDLLHYEQYEYLVDSEPGATQVAESVGAGRCVLFLGLQLPIGSGDQKSETSQQFISSWLSKDLDTSGEGQSLPRIAQDLEMERGRGELLRRLAAAAENPRVSPREILRRIARLNLPVIVTTRYDSFLEEELARQGHKVRRVLDGRKVPDQWASDEELMVRLFGSLDDQETLIVTEDDMWRFFNDFHMIADSLKSIFATRELLFVGYDPEDPAFRQLVSAIGQFRASRKGGCFLPTQDASIPAVRWAERRGLQLIDAEPGAFLALVEEVIVEQRRHDREEPKQKAIPLPDRPYKFLNYYDEADERIFFGRAEEAQRLISKVHAYGLNLLYAPSGSGKTSLIHAGVMPALRREGYTPFYVRVYDDPIGEIKRRALEALRPGAGAPGVDPEAPLPDLLIELAARTGGPIVIFVDQFEEIFVRHAAEVRASFADSVQECIERSGGRLRFVLSLREDFLARLAEFRQRIPAIFHNESRLGPLTLETARQAIVEPAKLLGIDVEADLVTRLLSDLETEGIEPPQLQIVMDHLYDAMPAGAKSITLKAYKALGETRKILAGYLDRVLQQLPAPKRRIGREILKTLVTSEETKVISRIADLVRSVGCSEEEALEILAEFSDHRLVRRVQTEDGHWYELVHEYLVEEIGRWLTAQEKEHKRIRELLEQALRNHRNLGLLMPGGQIQLVRAHEDDLNLSKEERQLLRASEQALTSRRKRTLALTAAAAVLLSVAGVTWRWFYLSTHVFIESTDRELVRNVRGELRTQRLETISVYSGSPARWWLDRQLGYPKLIRETDFELDQLDPQRRDAVKTGEGFAATADLEQALYERLRPEEQVKLLVTTSRMDEAAALVPGLYDNPSIGDDVLDRMTLFLAYSGQLDDAFIEKAIAHAYRRTMIPLPGLMLQQLASLVPLLQRLSVEERRRHLKPALEAERGLERSIGLLAVVGEEDDAPRLRVMLRSPDEQVQGQVFDALSALGDCTAAADAWEALAGPRRARRNAASYIARCGDASDVLRLEEAGTNPTVDELTMSAILGAMYELGGVSALPAMERLAGQRPELRLVRGFAAVQEPEVKSILRRFLSHEDPGTCDSAASELARRGDPSGAQVMLDLVRAGTTGQFGMPMGYSLSLLRGPQIRRVVLDRLQRSVDMDSMTHSFFLACLGPYDDDEVLEALLAALTDEDTAIRAAARQALAENGSDRVKERLRALEASDDPLAAVYARITLMDLDGEDRSAYFRRFLEDPPAAVNDLDVLIQAAGGLRDAWLRLPVSVAIEALGSTKHSVRAAAIRALAGHQSRLEALEPLARLASEGQPALRQAARQATWAIDFVERNRKDLLQAPRRAFDGGDTRRARRTLPAGVRGATVASALAIGLPSPVGADFRVPSLERESAELRAELDLAEGRLQAGAQGLSMLASRDRGHREALAANPRFQSLLRFYDYRLALGLELPILVEGLSLPTSDEPDKAEGAPPPAEPPADDIAPGDG